MSTILKALKRSEASRPRESHLPLGDVPDRGAVRHRWSGPWLAGTMLVLVAVGAGCWMLWPRTPVDASGGQEGLRRIAEVSLPARRQAATAPAPTPAKSGPESDTATRDRAEPEAPPSGEAPAEADGGVSGDGSSRDRPEPGEAGNTPAEADGENREREPELARQELGPYALLPRLEDLEPGRRRELPALDLNVHVHAARPGQRFVMINLSRYREGDRVAPGLTVAAIFPGGVVLQDGQGRFVLPRP